MDVDGHLWMSSTLTYFVRCLSKYQTFRWYLMLNLILFALVWNTLRIFFSPPIYTIHFKMMELLLTVMQTNFGRKKQNVERIVRINAGETNNNMQIPAKLHMYKATRIQIQKKERIRERESAGSLPVKWCTSLCLWCRI